MKNLLLALFLGLLSENSFGQTAIIAHKAHSGTAENFAFADPANYGGPPLIIERIIRINDTVAAAETNGMGPRTLLIINNRELQDSLKDSTRVLRMREYELDIMVGRDTASKIIPLNANETPQQRLDSMRLKSGNSEKAGQKSIEPKGAKKQKKSVLYFGLFLAVSFLFGLLRKRNARA